MVVTDGPNGGSGHSISFVAMDGAVEIGRWDGLRVGSSSLGTDEDRFFGVRAPSITAISIETAGSASNLEADHIQYGVADTVPATAELTAVGVAVVGSSFGAVGLSNREEVMLTSRGQLVPDDTDSEFNIYVRDLVTGEVERIDVGPGGVQADAGVRIESGAISSDGTRVLFASAATNLVAGGTPAGVEHLYLRDRETGTTTLVSVDGGGNPVASSEGRINDAAEFTAVVFTTDVGIDPGDTNGLDDVYLNDGGEISWISRTASGGAASADSQARGIDSETRYVAFQSESGEFVPGDTNGARDLFIHDLEFGTTFRASLALDGSELPSGVGFDSGAVSQDGRFAFFASDDPGIVAGDTNGQNDFFARDLASGTNERLTVDSAGAEGTFGLGPFSSNTFVSSDGRAVAWRSLDTLDPPDLNGQIDLFVRSTTGASDLNGDGDGDDSVLTVVSASSGALVNSLPGERISARQLSVAGGRVLAVVFESDEGADLNGDADQDDGVAHFYDGSPLGVQNLGVSVDEDARISDQVACLTVEELQEGETDLNGDGDTDDLVLHAGRVDQGGAVVLTNVGITSEIVVAAGSRCFVVRDELNELVSAPGCVNAGGSCDLNGDGDADDLVLSVVEVPPVGAPTVTNVGWSAEEIVPSEGGEAVGFYAVEPNESAPRPGCGVASGGGCDLNGDGDADDLVYQIYQVDLDVVVNAERQVLTCDFPVCEAFSLGLVEETGPDTVRATFIGTEDGQAVGFGCLPQSPPGGCDLDGNGLGGEIVLHIAHAKDGLLSRVQTLPFDLEAPYSPVPVQLVDQTIVTAQITECEAARYACPEFQDEGFEFSTTYFYEIGDCAARFDTDPNGAPGNPNDFFGALDCVTPRSWIVGDSDRAPSGGDIVRSPDGILDVASNGADDTCRETQNPEQEDADSDLAGDGVCDPPPLSLRPALAPCELDGNPAQVDERDVAAIVASLGIPAAAPDGWDARDRNLDGRISTFDSALCSLECTNPNCATTVGGGCGLLGLEALLLPLLVARLRQRRLGSYKGFAKGSSR